ncbi:protein of unknown function DUF55 [Thermobaculum terrenum ATCC BAA-798]|uniref:Uncharacterized protein n=1 Tax=Thermobaculum terrenum (strain ATCC BAA-798 / CCMEE 7001 / YNP1) TaxID=525904 RepID=D1CGC4_THET1|nr:restriction endonuclease [Thermobaculum terrenum]ACZ42795.1 protein of unknown function DUF55 [Thermobaculum terrenum ATCC BAA-798]
MIRIDEGATNYWLSLFTRETWLECAQHGFRVAGFPQHRWATVRRISPGDMLICYLTGASSYVGLLRVTGEPYQDDAVIWSSQIFPSRLPVEPIVTLHPDHGVPIKSLRDRLSYFRSSTNPHAWTGYFRTSPAQIRPEDARVIVEALKEAARDRSRVLDAGQLPALNMPGRLEDASRESSLVGVDEAEEAVVGELRAPTPAEAGPGAGTEPDEVEQLAGRLLSHARNSESSRLLEEAVVDAFSFLGFQVEHKSGSGDTDVLVFAPLGKNAYRAIVDAKSSRHERVANAAIDWMALSKHREMHQAAHTLIVAPGFAGGDLLENAREKQVALVTARDLAEIVRMHARTPLLPGGPAGAVLPPGRSRRTAADPAGSC